MASLQVRIPLLGAAVLAASLAIAAVLAFWFILFTRREAIEDALIREQRRVERALPQLVGEADGSNGIPDAEGLRLAAERYFRLNPGSDAYFTIVRVGDEVVAADDGPDVIERLHASGRIPRNRIPGIETLDTPLGAIVSLLTEIRVADGPPATLQVVAPIEPARAEALRALTWLGVASVSSLALTGGLLALALRRALRPLHTLASTAGTAELDALSLRVPEPRRMDEVGILAREFNRMLERLEAAAAGQRGFMATVSHELRTPVTIASGHIQVLESVGAESPRERAEALSLVRRELVRMRRLVDDLMTVARSKTEGFVVRRPVTLAALFDDLRLRLTGLGTRPVDVLRAPELTIEADRERLAQAVLNLVVNADVHTPAGGHIEVGARREADAVAIAVRDEGPGIDPAIRDTMFEPFVTGGGGHRSSGLGLAVVAAVVEAHQGTVDVDTGPGGTTFTIHLPMAGIEERATGDPGSPLGRT